MYAGWIASAGSKAKHISANVNNLTISSLFTTAEWRSGATKTIIVDPGVTIGSTSSGSPSLITGTTLGGYPLTGKIDLINNGNIYGAGGNANSVGGTALKAEIPINFTNNGNVYAGGGGGGQGGTGDAGYWWPEAKTWKYSGFAIPPLISWYTWYGDDYVEYNTGSPMANFSNPGLSTVLDNNNFRYYKGDFAYQWFTAYYYKIRRRSVSSQAGGTGGFGGKGQGSDNLTANAGLVGAVSNVSAGGTGGNGATWGTTGTTGVIGGLANTTYVDKTTSRTGGVAGGLGGYYIDGDSNVNWLSTGNRLGRVTG